MSTRLAAALDSVRFAIGKAEAGKQMDRTQIVISPVKTCFVGTSAFAGARVRRKIGLPLDQAAEATATASFTKGSSSGSPAAARPRMIFAISVRLAGVRMVAGSAATD